jgi:hypothetical protein
MFDPNWHYAVVVGINCYPAISKLHCSRSDALEFKQWLLDTGVPEKNIRAVITPKEDDDFTDPEAAIPTRDLVDRAFRQILIAVRKRLEDEPLGWESSRLYIYLSGHGASTPTVATLLMANAQRGFYSDGISPPLYLEYFEFTRVFHEVVCFSDCCRTLELTLHPTGPAWDRTIHTTDGIVTLTAYATGFGQAAYEPKRVTATHSVAGADSNGDRTGVASSDTNNGPPASDPADSGKKLKSASAYFTQALLEGLRNHAVDLDSHDINSVSLARYLNSRVKALTPNQDPQMLGELTAPIVFVPNPKIPSFQVTVRFPEGAQGNVSLLSSRKAVLCRHDCTAGPLVTSLWSGIYQVQADDARPFPNDGLFSVKGSDTTVQL